MTRLANQAASELELTSEQMILIVEFANSLKDAVDAGVVQRRWSCGSDKVECTPETNPHMGYLHMGCRWYFSLWTVEQRVVEEFYQIAQPGRHERGE